MAATRETGWCSVSQILCAAVRGCSWQAGIELPVSAYNNSKVPDFMMKASGALLLIVLTAVPFKAFADGEDNSSSLTLRSGEITLKPISKSSGERLGDGAKATQRRTRNLLQVVPGSQTISGHHVILEFERRLQGQDFASLAAKGVQVWNYIDGNCYTATITHDSIDKLSEATKDIDKVIRFAVIESQHKIERSLGVQSRALAATRAIRAPSKPVVLSVELWPDADFEAAKAELSALGQIQNENEYTKRLDIVLPLQACCRSLQPAKL